MSEFEHEPKIATQLTIQTMTDSGWQSHPAAIADLTRQELWVSLDTGLAEPLDPGRSVRLELRHPNRPTQTAETIVLWHIGKSGNVVGLKRPLLWDPPSRREHSRVGLALPVYLRGEGPEPVPTMSTNIGVGGLLCVAAMELRIAQRVDVSIQLTPDHHFDCVAEVARLDDDPNDPVGMQLLVGLQFVDLTPDDQGYLASAITRLAADVDGNLVPRPWQPEAPAVEAPPVIDPETGGEILFVAELGGDPDADAEGADDADSPADQERLAS